MFITTLLQCTIGKWVAEFKDRTRDFEGAPRGGRPSITTT
ncbi:unnamed protein product, partial [Didymodactylos carnosus]